MISDGDSKTDSLYSKAGVDEPREQQALKGMLHWLKKTYSFRTGIGSTSYSIGHFANVLNMGGGLGLVLTTDGVGTKLMIAQKLNRFDTVGIDCVANNVNDILCMGAEPIAMLDYIAINAIDERVLEDIAKGLCHGAEKAHISIPGGEIAQVREMLAPAPTGETALDLVGSAVGVVALSPERDDLPQLIDGKRVEPGDLVIGLLSSGLHSNGYSLARKVLLEKAQLRLDQDVPELGRTLGDELLQPTHIYVGPVLGLLQKGFPVHGMVNISGGGLLNLGRLPNECSYIIDNLPPVPPIFRLIRELGSISDAEMFATFNMGIGFCLIAGADAGQAILTEVSNAGYQAVILGKVEGQPGGHILLPDYHLKGRGDVFETGQ